MSKNTKHLPPYEEEVQFTDEQKEIVDRLKKELESRLNTRVSFRAFKYNQLVEPYTDILGSMHVEVQVQNWKKIAMISPAQVEYGHGDGFYYFMKNLANSFMNDLLIKGARAESPFR